MKQIDLREGARRQHRAIFLFAVIQCWLLDLDGVAFERLHFKRLLGLERFKKTRIDWLREDLKEFFPYQKTYFFSKTPDSFHSIIVSRVKFEKHLITGSMSMSKRLDSIEPIKGQRTPRLAIFEMWAATRPPNAAKVAESIAPFFAESANYDERFLSAYLALLSQGQISPRSLPSLKMDQSS